MPFDYNAAFCSLGVGMPDDIARLKEAGFYREAIARIDKYLAEDWTATQNGADNVTANSPVNPAPHGLDAQRQALMVQREIMRRLPEEYCLTRDEAIARMQQLVAGFTPAEFTALEEDNRIDWRFVEGEKRYLYRFAETLTATDPALHARLLEPQPDNTAARQHRRRIHEQMKQTGSASARISLKTGVGMSDEAFANALASAKAAGRDSVHVRAWLPLPAACPAQSDIVLESFSVPPTHIAAETAPQRTAYWEADLTENCFFTAEYSYTSTARYAVPEAVADAMPEQPEDDFAEDLQEQAPHIVFTPYLRALAAQLTQGLTDPAQKARRFYDYITLNVHYHYQPCYFVLDCLPDHCARDRRGDCGIMALTFITLCRIAGIPARWQSGLAVAPDRCGCHDWARFYLPDKGWLYADCSYGASMARSGDEEMRQHYFGSLDPGRMVANRVFQGRFDPPMYGFRADPYDNQTGEIEVDGMGLHGEQLRTEKQTMRYIELE